MADDLNLIENEEEIITEETIEIIAADSTETAVIEASEAFPALGEDNDEMNHAKLYGRDFDDQHPISAITGLQEKFDAIESLKTVYSDRKQQADYYKWADENPLREWRDGLFVSVMQDSDYVQICDCDNDVFGVTVAEAAFVGNQEYYQIDGGVKVGRDRTYCLVMHSGPVAVRREIDVMTGDYVTPNIRGEAKKTDGDYGYLVTALREVDGVQYAIIMLGESSTLNQKKAKSIEDLKERMISAEFDIVSATDVARSAHTLAVKTQETTEEDLEVIEGKVDDILKDMDIAYEDIGQLNQSVENATLVAELARTIAYGAVSSAAAIRNEAVSTANEASKNVSDLIKKFEPIDEWVDEETHNSGAEYLIRYINDGLATKNEVLTVDTKTEKALSSTEKNAKNIQSLVQTISEYAVGEYSQAYGLTHEQAQSILSEDMIYVPTETRDGLYIDNSTEFIKGFYYKWDGIQWVPSISNAVRFSDEFQLGSTSAPYWLVTDGDVILEFISTWNIAGKDQSRIYYEINSKLYWRYTEDSWQSFGPLDNKYAVADATVAYDLGGLYLWEDGSWTKVAAIIDNTLSRAVSAIKQTSNEVKAEVTDAVGDAASLKIRLTNIDSSVTTLASHVIGDYITVDMFVSEGKDMDKIYYANDTKQYYYYTDDGWKATDKAYEAGLSGTMATIEQKADDSGASIAQVVEAIGEDGEVTVSSIVQAINDGKSTINLSADRIDLDTSQVIIGLNNKVNGAIRSTRVLYCPGKYATTFEKYSETSDWSEHATWIDGAYMWQKTEITYADGATSESNPVCIQGAKGANGTGVSIQGTAYVPSDIVVDDAYIGQSSLLYADEECTEANQIKDGDFGDAFMVNGYLFVYDHDDYFVCVGQIKGDTGAPGNDGKDGFGIKKINTHVREFTLDDWEKHGAIGKETGWTATTSQYDNTHINIGDTAYITGIVKDVEGANGSQVQAVLYGVVTRKTSTEIYMESSYLMIGGSKGDTGSQGIGVAQVIAQYCLSISKTEAPDQNSDNWTDNFDSVLDRYWSSTSTEDKYIWYRDKIIYSDHTEAKPHIDYTTPRVDTASSTIADWCYENDKTVINGANIATGTITAQKIDVDDLIASGSIAVKSDVPTEDKITTITNDTISTTDVLAENLQVKAANIQDLTTSSITVVGTSQTLADKLNNVDANIEDISTDIQATIDQLQFGVQNLATPANAVLTSSNSTVLDGVYTVYTPQFQHGIKLSASIFELGKSYVISFKLKDLYGASVEDDIKPNTRIDAIGGHCLAPWGAFNITRAIIDGQVPDETENYDGGYSLDLTKDVHTVVLFLTKVSDTITGDDAAVYIQPSRNHNGNPDVYTTLSEIWDLVVVESDVVPTSWVSYQYVTTETMETPGSAATWIDSFPTNWVGKSIVWRRTKTRTSTGHVTYGEPVMLSSADAARMAAELAGQDVGAWCQANNVTVIDGSNLMTGTIDAAEIDVINIKAENINATKLSVITSTMGTLDAGCIQSKNYSAEDGELIIQSNEPTPSSGLNLTLSDDGTYYIVNGIGTCTDTKIVIPYRQGGYEVKEIAVQAFKNCTNITEVYIPRSVVTIGGAAFSGCSALTSITLPFVGGDKQLSNEPDTRQSFGYIFGTVSYTGSTKVTQTYNFTTKKTYTYYMPTTLKTIRITGGEIGHAAFNGVPFSGRTLILDYGVKSIGDYAFYQCRLLGNIDLPESITSIGSYAFYEWGNYGSDDLDLIIPDSVKSIGYYAFYNCIKLASVTIGSGVENIGGMAFAKCSNLNELIIKEGVRQLGDLVEESRIFYQCTSLTAIVLPESIMHIGMMAFEECTGLQSVYMPINSQLVTIRYQAFNRCTNLTTVYLGGNVTHLDEAFRMSAISTVYYYGTQADRYNIDIIDNYGYLTKANWYYYDDEDKRDAHGMLWRRNLTSGFRISCEEDDNLIDSRYFKVSQDGKVTAQNATLRGSITADSGRIGGLLLTSNALQSNNFQLSTIKVGSNTESIIAFYDGDNVATSIDSHVVGAGHIEAQQSMHTPVLYTDALSLNNGLQLTYSRITYGERYIEFGDSDTVKSYTATLSSESADTQLKITITPEPLIYDKTFNIACYCRSGKTRYCTITIPRNQTTGFFSIPLGWIVEYASIDEDGSNGNTYTFTQSTASELIKISGSLIPTQDAKYDLGGPSPNRWKDIYASNSTIQTSDANEKNTIEPLDDKYNQLFDGLQGVSYKFNNNTSDRTHIGFIAQDVERAILNSGLTTQDFAGICKWEKEGDLNGYGLRYGEFIALNTDQIQKLKKRVAELEEKIKELTTKQND